MKHPIMRNPHSGMIALLATLVLLILIIIGAFFGGDAR